MNIERFKNAPYDVIFEEWKTTHPDDPSSIELFKEAYEIFQYKLPNIGVKNDTQHFAANTLYWTNCPTIDNPYQTIWAYRSTAFFLFTGYPPSCINKTGNYFGVVRPVSIASNTVYFTTDVQKFRGVNLMMYGPFDSGDAAVIVIENAEFLIRIGLTLYTPLGLSRLSAITSDISEIKSNLATQSSIMASLKTNIASLEAQLGTITNSLNILGACITVLAVTFVIVIIRE